MHPGISTEAFTLFLVYPPSTLPTLCLSPTSDSYTLLLDKFRLKLAAKPLSVYVSAQPSSTF